jgi:hypothetical protein
MQGQDVVSSDDHKLGTVLAERDDCVIVESGHVFKAKHAIPRQFLHEHDGVLRATIAKDVVTGSPKLDGDAIDTPAVRAYYGLDTTYVTNPDPDGLDSAETVGARQGVNPAPSERLATLGETETPGYRKPIVRDRQANAFDPTGVTANLSDRNRSNRKAD